MIPDMPPMPSARNCCLHGALAELRGEMAA
jgi:hypothetical protein